MSDTITCPNCDFSIEVTEVLSAQLRAQLQKEFEAQTRRKEAALAEREKAVAHAQEAVKNAQEDIDRRVSEKLEHERKQLSEAALAKAREQVTLEMRDKDEQLTEAQSKLKAAQDAELTLRKERRALEEQKESLELTLSRQLDEERGKIREAAKKEADEERQLKDAEREKLTSDPNREEDPEYIVRLVGQVIRVSLETVKIVNALPAFQ